jgi:ABC-type microcin C transport system permease subunit YejB
MSSAFFIVQLVPVAAIVVLLVLLVAVSGTVRTTGRAVERVERKLDLVLKHLDINVPAAAGIPPETLAEIDRCLWSDRRAEAIRLYREATGHTAVQAKEWIERRAASY